LSTSPSIPIQGLTNCSGTSACGRAINLFSLNIRVDRWKVLLCDRIKGNTEAIWCGSGGNFVTGLRPKKNHLWSSPVVFPSYTTYHVLRQRRLRLDRSLGGKPERREQKSLSWVLLSRLSIDSVNKGLNRKLSSQLPTIHAELWQPLQPATRAIIAPTHGAYLWHQTGSV
jgi:hypothetical protein